MISPRPELLVDEKGRRIGDSTTGTVGTPGPLPGCRLVWAMLTNSPGGGMSRRYSPPWPPAEVATIGLDMDMVIPKGAGVQSAALSIWTNSAVPAQSTDFTIGAVTIEDRQAYAALSGGVSGRDYQLRWLIVDTLGNDYQRTGLLLCALTS
jgi:hypothetical protein